MLRAGREARPRLAPGEARGARRAGPAALTPRAREGARCSRKPRGDSLLSAPGDSRPTPPSVFSAQNENAGAAPRSRSPGSWRPTAGRAAGPGEPVPDESGPYTFHLSPQWILGLNVKHGAVQLLEDNAVTLLGMGAQCARGVPGHALGTQGVCGGPRARMGGQGLCGGPRACVGGPECTRGARAWWGAQGTRGGPGRAWGAQGAHACRASVRQTQSSREGPREGCFHSGSLGPAGNAQDA